MFVRKTVLFFIIALVLFSCSKQVDTMVDWRPSQPKAGEVVTIHFNPEKSEHLSVNTDSLYIVYQVQNVFHEQISRAPMNFRNGEWTTDIQTGAEFLVLNFKFEDNHGRAEDNSGKRWSIFLRDADGRIQKDSHYLVGDFLNRMDPTQYAFSSAYAMTEFKKEINRYPENYSVWFDFWFTQLMNTEQKMSTLARIRHQFDSLKTIAQDNPEFLHLGFRTNSMLLKDIPTAIRYGEQLLAAYKEYSHAEEIALSLIYLKYGGSATDLVTGLKKLADSAGDEKVSKSLNYQLGNIFQQHRDVDNAIKYFKRVIDIDKTEIPVRLSLARLYLQKRDFNTADLMIQQAETNSTTDNFIRSNPWEHPSQRMSWLNLNRCQVHSLRAALNFELGQYKQAIDNRKMALSLGTPFPAFEWTQIGDSYMKTDEIDSARFAYLHAVSINNAQEDAIQSLKDIYRRMNGAPDNFEGWMLEEVEKIDRASAKEAPQFELTDLAGIPARLADQRGKIVVLTFWDSWSRECQLELSQLNMLVNSFKDNQSVAFWAISVEAPVSVSAFIKKNPFAFRLFPLGSEAKRKYEVIGFPTHIIIDKNGLIRFTQIGFAGDILQKLQKEIQRLIDENESVS